MPRWIGDIGRQGAVQNLQNTNTKKSTQKTAPNTLGGRTVSTATSQKGWFQSLCNFFSSLFSSSNTPPPPITKKKVSQGPIFSAATLAAQLRAKIGPNQGETFQTTESPALTKQHSPPAPQKSTPKRSNLGRLPTLPTKKPGNIHSATELGKMAGKKKPTTPS